MTTTTVVQETVLVLNDKLNSILRAVSGPESTSNTFTSFGSRYKNATIDIERLWHNLDFTSQWGLTSESQGMHRTALSQPDKAVREWFIKETSTLGCKVSVDAMGNIFAVYPSASPGRAPIAMGSHLDTQPAGGKFDGILGVLAAIEVIRAVHNGGIKLSYPLAAVVWTNEEGAVFFPGCSGSSVWADWVPLEDAYKQSHKETGQTLEAALDEIGAKGAIPASSHANPLQAHFELHIEQGGILEENNQSIGVVRRIQGIRRYKITCHGEQGHAGTVRIENRADALVAAAKIVLQVESLARACHAYATIGVLQVENSSPNTIPSLVNMTIDTRHSHEQTLDLLEQQMFAYMDQMAALKPDWAVTKQKIWHSPAQLFDATIAECISSAATAQFGEARVRDMASLAGHDSAMTALQVPTAMIFVPSRGGISHSPLEYTSREYCGRGAQTLLHAVLQYHDKLVGHASSSDVRYDISNRIRRSCAHQVLCEQSGQKTAALVNRAGISGLEKKFRISETLVTTDANVE